MRTEGDDVAVIIYTSGTTGQPKGAQLTHTNLLFNAVASSALFDQAPDSHDVFLTVLPLFHICGQTTMMNAALYRHGTMVLMPRFDGDEALSLMEKEKVTIFAGVPTMYWGLLNAQGDHDIKQISQTLHTAVSGGASLPAEVARKVKEKFGIGIPGRLRPLRNLSRGVLQQPQAQSQAGVDRAAHLGRGDEARRRELQHH